MINDKLYKYVSISGAFLMWGFWAFYINPGTLESRLTSALCQGLLSAIATSLMISSLKALRKHFQNLLTPPLIVTSVTTTTGVVAHLLIGTAEIFATLAPAVSVALIFSIITSYNLSRNTARKSI